MKRHELIGEAQKRIQIATKAHKAGEKGLAAAYYQQAADRYRAAGMTGMVGWCARQAAK